MARVVIVDDHLLIAETLRIALAAREIPATVVTPCALAELATAVLGEQPDLVLLDLDLGAIGDATPLVAPLTRAGSRVLIVSGVPDRLRIATALQQGAIGYRSKTDGLDLLVATAVEALTGPVPLDAATRSSLLDELRRERQRLAGLLGPFDSLTDREGAVLRAMARGFAVADIAADWVVSEATVRSHVHGVLRKLGVRSQLAAVAAAVQAGWLATSEFTREAPAAVDGDLVATGGRAGQVRHLRRPA